MATARIVHIDETEGAHTLDDEAPGNSKNSCSLMRVQFFKTFLFAGHGDGTQSVDADLKELVSNRGWNVECNKDTMDW